MDGWGDQRETVYGAGPAGEALLITSLLYSHAPMLILNKGPFLTWSEDVSWGFCLAITQDVNLTCPVIWGIMFFSKLQRDPGHIVLSVTSLLLSLMHWQHSLPPAPPPPVVATQVYWVGDRRCFHIKCQKSHLQS